MASLKVFVLVATIVVAASAEYYENEQGGHGEYQFAYGVKDPHTGDNHERQEVSDGHIVKGAYTLKEADGTRRVVEYVAGPHSGFNAVVKKIGHAYHPQNYQMHNSGMKNSGSAGNLGGSNTGAGASEYLDGHAADYKFAYGVKDPHTGDHHERQEVSDGHVVKGSYSLNEADGTKRIVEYVADPHNGFNAVVKRIGHANHPMHYKTN